MRNQGKVLKTIACSSGVMPSTSSYFNSFSTFHAVKHDCVFGDDFDLNEISYVSEVLFWNSSTLCPSYSHLKTEIGNVMEDPLEATNYVSFNPGSQGV